MSLESATRLTPAGEGQWVGELGEDWDILGNTNGGYMLAMASRAGTEATGGRVPVSVTGHYLRPGRAGPIEVTTEVVREGRRFATVRSHLSQNGSVILTTLGSFADNAEDDPEILLSDAEIPDLPPPEECIHVLPVGGLPFPPPFLAQLEMRVEEAMTGMLRGQPVGEFVTRGWLRPSDGEQLSPHFLVLACDAFPPTTFNGGLPIAWTPTLELTAHIRRPHTQGWLRCLNRTRFISSGFIEVDGLIWDQEDRLVAQARQLALLPKA